MREPLRPPSESTTHERGRSTEAEPTGGNRPGVGYLDVAIVLVTVAVAYTLKRFYSSASAEDLAWILRPTVGLVQAATGASFVAEAGEGYLSRDLHLLIAPSCAGVNFLIAAFCTGVLGLVRLQGGVRGKLLVLFGSAVGSFALTIVANATRLLIGIWLAGMSTGLRGIGGETLHRAEGVVTYFTFLCTGFLAARWLAERRGPDARAA